MPSQSWLANWRAYQRNGGPDPEQLRGPTVQISQYEKAVERWRSATNDKEWERHQEAQRDKAKETHHAEVDRLLRIMLGDDIDA